MPGKNKPKRLDRHRSSRVARRKKKQEERVKGLGRNRPKRDKKDKKGLISKAKDLLTKVAVNNK